MWETGKLVQCTAGENRKWYSLCVVWQFFKKVKNKITTWPRNSTSTSKRIESTNSNRYFYTHVFTRIIHKSQRVETTHVFIDRRMDRQNVMYTYSILLFSLKKEDNSDTWYNTDEPWSHYAKQNQPVTEGQVLYDSTQKCLV